MSLGDLEIRQDLQKIQIFKRGLWVVLLVTAISLESQYKVHGPLELSVMACLAVLVLLEVLIPSKLLPHPLVSLVLFVGLCPMVIGSLTLGREPAVPVIDGQAGLTRGLLCLLARLLLAAYGIALLAVAGVKLFFRKP